MVSSLNNSSTHDKTFSRKEKVSELRQPKYVFGPKFKLVNDYKYEPSVNVQGARNLETIYETCNNHGGGSISPRKPLYSSQVDSKISDSPKSFKSCSKSVSKVDTSFENYTFSRDLGET